MSQAERLELTQTQFHLPTICKLSNEMNKQTSASNSATDVSLVTEHSSASAPLCAVTAVNISNSCQNSINNIYPNQSNSKVSKSKTNPLCLNQFSETPSVCQQKLTSELDAGGDLKCWWRRTRLNVALLGLAIAAVNCYAQATFCIAIVEMVLPADYMARSNDFNRTSEPLMELRRDSFASKEDQSCPIQQRYRVYYDDWRFPEGSVVPSSRLNATNGSRQDVAPVFATSSQLDLSNRFNWDAGQQGLLLGAFAFGTAPLQIVGGRLAEIYGSKWVLLTGCIGTALTSLTIPYIAHHSFLLLLVNRIVMGVAQAGMEPGLICLLADWLTPQEAGFFISMLLFAMCLGFFLGSLCSSLILALGYGWPLAYYVAGGLNLVVGIVWLLYADSWPRASKYIDQRELDYILKEQKRQKKLEPPKNDLMANISISPTLAGAHNHSIIPAETLSEETNPIEAPWRNILSTRSVWAFIICKISIRWCADVMTNDLPTYLANVLHLSIKVNGLLNSIATALFMISSFVTGWLVNEIFVEDKNGASMVSSSSKTRVRKTFQSIASFGSAICLVLMTQYDCDIVFSMSMMLILSCCLVMGTGGELQIPYDMTSRYPGTLHGMACTLSVSGWLAPPLIGLILGDQPSSRARWSLVWYSTAAISLIGGLAFVFFADSSPRDFDTSREEKKKRAPNTSTSNMEQGDRNSGQEDSMGYVNKALNSSSCESSPKSMHEKNLAQNTCSAPVEPRMTPEDSVMGKDAEELTKMTQLESSFSSTEPQVDPLALRLSTAVEVGQSRASPIDRLISSTADEKKAAPIASESLDSERHECSQTRADTSKSKMISEATLPNVELEACSANKPAIVVLAARKSEDLNSSGRISLAIPQCAPSSTCESEIIAIDHESDDRMQRPNMDSRQNEKQQVVCSLRAKSTELAEPPDDAVSITRL